MNAPHRLPGTRRHLLLAVFASFAASLLITVLLLANAPGPTGATSERPIAWVHNVPGGGRLFYSAFGHDVKAFQEASFMNQIMTGIKWAAHRIN